ncbi:hypothetical protein Aazo_3434 ['Nostoc azollae' 0708]|jgi:hypothetical protein|uniref:Uncharacterized protein n=1 Tax=Nostoc azollae (strain 0708) TaxID=551115 RepID=D7E305_NOSA0|nr:hypothetical protein Aazo_3434 ['Nostoc azollae' 0708]
MGSIAHTPSELKSTRAAYWLIKLCDAYATKLIKLSVAPFPPSKTPQPAHPNTSHHFPASPAIHESICHPTMISF